MDIVRKDHTYGTHFSHSLAYKDFVIAEVHKDQFSVNWTSRISVPAFVDIWSDVADQGDAVLYFRKAEPIELYAFELSKIARERSFGKGPPRLVRLWLDDASVAWQNIQLSPDSDVALLGIASDGFDYSAITTYIERTSTPGVSKIAKEFLMTVFADSPFSRSRMGSLRAALEYSVAQLGSIESTDDEGYRD
jgi:hypothetical protein